MIENELILCECGNPEHQIIMSKYHDNDPEIFFCVHLTKQPLFRRLGIAIKYILGYRSKHGPFVEMVLMPEQQEQITKFLGK